MQLKLAEKRFLHSREPLPTGEGEHVTSRYGPRCKKEDDTDWTADLSDTKEIRRDRPTRVTDKGEKGHHKESWTDDEPFPF